MYAIVEEHSFAHVIASKHALPLGYTRPVIGAYCGDAMLAWKQGAAYYEVTLKCGTLQELRIMQRSMRRY
jgi:hypothetical protein